MKPAFFDHSGKTITSGQPVSVASACSLPRDAVRRKHPDTFTKGRDSQGVFYEGFIVAVGYESGSEELAVVAASKDAAVSACNELFPDLPIDSSRVQKVKIHQSC